MPTDSKRNTPNISLTQIFNIITNAAMIVTVFFSVQTGLTLVALLIFVISKWRVFSGRIEALPKNILNASCDIIFGLSIIWLLAFYNSLDGFGTTTIVLAVLFGFWQLVLKPMSAQPAIALQSFVMLAAGLVAVWSGFDDIYAGIGIIPVLLTTVVGFISAYHILRQTDETSENAILLSGIWALILTQFGWMAWLWNIQYALATPGFVIPQIAVIGPLFASYLYSLIMARSMVDQQARQSLIQQSIFVAILMVLIFFFTEWSAQIV